MEPPLIKGGGGRGGGRTFPKFSHFGGGGGGLPKILLERGDNPEKGGADIEMRGLPLFFITLQFNCILCVGEKSKVSFITF